MTDTVKNIALLCNPTADNEKALDLTHTLSGLLHNRQLNHQAFTTSWPENYEGFTEVWLVGGDGTANYFINHYPSVTLPLVIFPGGTGNDLHWMLYGDVETKVQLDQVLAGSPRKVDAGVCNGQFFLNGVGIGFDGAIVKDLLGKRKLAGKASYLLSILKNIVGYQEAHYTVTCPDGSVFEQDCLLISVANAQRYGGGFHVAPRASLNDALLDVNLVGRISPLKRLRYLPVIERGEHIELPFVHYHQWPSLIIESREEVPTHLDGEFVSARRFEFSVLPEKFSFIY